MTLEWGWDAAGPGQNESGLGEREVRTELTRRRWEWESWAWRETNTVQGPSSHTDKQSGAL